MEEEQEIRIKPRETDLLVKMLKLRMQGYNDYQIARKLNMPYNSVRRRLERLERDYLRICKFIKTIQKTRYFDKKRLEMFTSPEIRKKADFTIHELLSQGVPLIVGNAAGPSSIGYKHVENKVEVNPEKAQLAKEIFKTYYEGGNMAQLCREHGLNPSNIPRMLHNPIYIGKIIYKGKEYFFPQLAIIDIEIWEACQPFEKLTPYIFSVRKFGFIRKAGRLFKDSEATPKIKQVIDLRIQRESQNAIAEATELPRWVVRRILKDPLYGGKALVNGKYLDAGVEPHVPFEKWLKAHETFSGRRPIEISRDKRRQREAERKLNLLNYLQTHPGKRWSEMMKTVNYSEFTLNRYLRFLKSKGYVEKRDRKWYITESGKQRLLNA